MEQQKIERINELSRLSRERALTDAEQQERASLRQAYLAAMRQSLQSTLDNTWSVDEAGNRTRLQKAPE